MNTRTSKPSVNIGCMEKKNRMNCCLVYMQSVSSPPTAPLAVYLNFKLASCQGPQNHQYTVVWDVGVKQINMIFLTWWNIIHYIQTGHLSIRSNTMSDATARERRHRQHHRASAPMPLLANPIRERVAEWASRCSKSAPTCWLAGWARMVVINFGGMGVQHIQMDVLHCQFFVPIV